MISWALALWSAFCLSVGLLLGSLGEPKTTSTGSPVAFGLGCGLLVWTVGLALFLFLQAVIP